MNILDRKAEKKLKSSCLQKKAEEKNNLGVAPEILHLFVLPQSEEGLTSHTDVR